MSEQATSWHVGQQAIINRLQVVTIERITPSGRVMANGRTFEASGTERSGGDPFRRARMEPLTPAIQAEMDLVSRGRKARGDAEIALAAAEKWLGQALITWGRKVPDVEDVEKAERLAAAIRGVMEEPDHG